MKSILNNIYEYLPHEIVKKIQKTAEGRGGKGIYKRRNKRSYRVLIQYKTWNKLINNNPELLEKYEQGYAVIISPEEYFGDNYPNKSNDLNKNFELSKTGFVNTP